MLVGFPFFYPVPSAPPVDDSDDDCPSSSTSSICSQNTTNHCMHQKRQRSSSDESLHLSDGEEELFSERSVHKRRKESEILDDEEPLIPPSFEGASHLSSTPQTRIDQHTIPTLRQYQQILRTRQLLSQKSLDGSSSSTSSTQTFQDERQSQDLYDRELLLDVLKKHNERFFLHQPQEVEIAQVSENEGDETLNPLLTDIDGDSTEILDLFDSYKQLSHHTVRDNFYESYYLYLTNHVEENPGHTKLLTALLLMRMEYPQAIFLLRNQSVALEEGGFERTWFLQHKPLFEACLKTMDVARYVSTSSTSSLSSTEMTSSSFSSQLFPKRIKVVKNKKTHDLMHTTHLSCAIGHVCNIFMAIRLPKIVSPSFFSRFSLRSAPSSFSVSADPTGSLYPTLPIDSLQEAHTISKNAQEASSSQATPTGEPGVLFPSGPGTAHLNNPAPQPSPLLLSPPPSLTTTAITPTFFETKEDTPTAFLQNDFTKMSVSSALSTPAAVPTPLLPPFSHSDHSEPPHPFFSVSQGNSTSNSPSTFAPSFQDSTSSLSPMNIDSSPSISEPSLSLDVEMTPTSSTTNHPQVSGNKFSLF